MGANVATRRVRALATKKYRLKTDLSLPKILVCVDWFAPGYKAGGPIQSCMNFAYAMREDYQIYVLTTDRDAGDPAPYLNIHTDEWADFDTNIKVYYSSPNGLNYTNIRKIITATAPDFLYLNSLYSLYFTIIPLVIAKYGRLKCKTILSPRGMLKASALRFKKYKKIPFVYFLKYSGVLRNIAFHATDEQEKKDITAYFGNKNEIALIANFPKLNYLPYNTIKKVEKQLDIIYFSRIHPIKNLDFCIEILKNIPNDIFINFNIYGNIEDENYWADCQKGMATLPSNITVSYKGEVVNSAVLDVISAQHLFLLPTSGENFGHAIWEALLASRPVLISDQTPWLNLQAQNTGWDLPLAEKNSWIAAITAAANWSQQDFDDICKNISIFAQNYIDNNTTKIQFKAFFK